MYGTSPRHSVQGVGEWEPGSWVRLERLARKGVGILKSADPNAALLLYTHKYNTPIFVGVGGRGGGVMEFPIPHAPSKAAHGQGVNRGEGIGGWGFGVEGWVHLSDPYNTPFPEASHSRTQPRWL